jgi:hypothetical protein
MDEPASGSRVYDHQRGDPSTLQMEVYWPLGQP